uniref:Uncharacterized protein n=1 Tax=Oryzias sinensis TaxID=183150 RepID=A0A8C8DEV3_9TELE
QGSFHTCRTMRGNQTRTKAEPNVNVSTCKRHLQHFYQQFWIHRSPFQHGIRQSFPRVRTVCV